MTSFVRDAIDVSFLCACIVIDHEFRHNIVKVAADYFDNVMTKFIVNNRKDALKMTSICFLR